MSMAKLESTVPSLLKRARPLLGEVNAPPTRILPSGRTKAELMAVNILLTGEGMNAPPLTWAGPLKLASRAPSAVNRPNRAPWIRGKISPPCTKTLPSGCNAKSENGLAADAGTKVGSTAPEVVGNGLTVSMAAALLVERTALATSTA